MGSWNGSNPKWDQVEHHQAPLQPHPQLTAVDLPNGLLIHGAMMRTTMPIATGTITAPHVNALILTMVVAPPQDPLFGLLLMSLFQPPIHQLKDVDPLAGPLINGVMMKTTMPSAIMMVELAVGKFKQPSALNAHVLILHFQQPLPRQQQPQQPQLQPPPLHHQKAVDPQVGPRINGAMTRTTMPNAIGMVELVALMIIVDGTHIAKIVSVLSVHHLDGMAITTVTTI